jgi:hypothetical protein
VGEDGREDRCEGGGAYAVQGRRGLDADAVVWIPRGPEECVRRDWVAQFAESGACLLARPRVGVLGGANQGFEYRRPADLAQHAHSANGSRAGLGKCDQRWRGVRPERQKQILGAVRDLILLVLDCLGEDVHDFIARGAIAC